MQVEGILGKATIQWRQTEKYIERRNNHRQRRTVESSKFIKSEFEKALEIEKQ